MFVGRARLAGAVNSFPLQSPNLWHCPFAISNRKLLAACLAGHRLLVLDGQYPHRPPEPGLPFPAPEASCPVEQNLRGMLSLFGICVLSSMPTLFYLRHSDELPAPTTPRLSTSRVCPKALAKVQGVETT